MSHLIRHDKSEKQKSNAMKQHEYYVYITTNPNRTVLYIGITNDIARRLVEHYANRGKVETFAGKTYCYCLIYIELY